MLEKWKNGKMEYVEIFEEYLRNIIELIPFNPIFQHSNIPVFRHPDIWQNK
jgi:hypothetical protein